MSIYHLILPYQNVVLITMTPEDKIAQLRQELRERYERHVRGPREQELKEKEEQKKSELPAATRDLGTSKKAIETQLAQTLDQSKQIEKERQQIQQALEKVLFSELNNLIHLESYRSFYFCDFISFQTIPDLARITENISKLQHYSSSFENPLHEISNILSQDSPFKDIVLCTEYLAATHATLDLLQSHIRKIVSTLQGIHDFKLLSFQEDNGNWVKGPEYLILCFDWYRQFQNCLLSYEKVTALLQTVKAQAAQFQHQYKQLTSAADKTPFQDPGVTVSSLPATLPVTISPSTTPASERPPDSTALVGFHAQYKQVFGRPLPKDIHDLILSMLSDIDLIPLGRTSKTNWEYIKIIRRERAESYLRMDANISDVWQVFQALSLSECFKLACYKQADAPTPNLVRLRNILSNTCDWEASSQSIPVQSHSRYWYEVLRNPAVNLFDYMHPHLYLAQTVITPLKASWVGQKILVTQRAYVDVFKRCLVGVGDHPPGMATALFMNQLSEIECKYFINILPFIAENSVHLETFNRRHDLSKVIQPWIQANSGDNKHHETLILLIFAITAYKPFLLQLNPQLIDKNHYFLKAILHGLELKNPALIDWLKNDFVCDYLTSLFIAQTVDKGILNENTIREQKYATDIANALLNWPQARNELPLKLTAAAMFLPYYDSYKKISHPLLRFIDAAIGFILSLALRLVLLILMINPIACFLASFNASWWVFKYSVTQQLSLPMRALLMLTSVSIILAAPIVAYVAQFATLILPFEFVLISLFERKDIITDTKFGIASITFHLSQFWKVCTKKNGPNDIDNLSFLTPTLIFISCVILAPLVLAAITLMSLNTLLSIGIPVASLAVIYGALYLIFERPHYLVSGWRALKELAAWVDKPVGIIVGPVLGILSALMIYNPITCLLGALDISLWKHFGVANILRILISPIVFPLTALFYHLIDGVKMGYQQGLLGAFKVPGNAWNNAPYYTSEIVLPWIVVGLAAAAVGGLLTMGVAAVSTALFSPLSTALSYVSLNTVGIAATAIVVGAYLYELLQVPLAFFRDKQLPDRLNRCYDIEPKTKFSEASKEATGIHQESTKTKVILDATPSFVGKSSHKLRKQFRTTEVTAWQFFALPKDPSQASKKATAPSSVAALSIPISTPHR